MRKSEKFMKVFSELGRDWQSTCEMSDILEEYVCVLYGSTIDSVDVTNMFMKKQTRENKAIDLSVLPPCQKSQFCCRYVEKNRKRTNIGWQADGSIDWITEIYPDGIYNLLLQQDDIKTDGEQCHFYESDIENDEDDP